MKTYEQTDLRDGLTISSQTENFIMLNSSRSWVPLDDLEYLLSVGLECHGVSPGPNYSTMICCRKTV